jgi:UDP-N-acetylglucosamine acyltransferase
MNSQRHSHCLENNAPAGAPHEPILRIHRGADAEAAVHPTACVAPSARLGAGVSVGEYAVIQDQTELGDGCVIGPHATILRHATLGNGCRVHAGAVVGDLPQDRAFQNVASSVRIGARTVIREFVTVHRGTKAGSCTVVGEGCLLMANSHVGHNAVVGNGVTLANGALLAGHTEVGDGAFISGHCLVHQFTRVGRLAMMAGGSAAQMDVPPFCITRSLTSNTVLSLNIIGLRRAGFSSEERMAVKRAFDLLYRSGATVDKAAALIEAQATTAHELELCAFVRSAKRGICKFFRTARRENREETEEAA